MLLLTASLLLAPPSAAALLEKTQKAYDGLKTLQQDVVGQIDGMKGTAHIAFVRPGRLRVTGMSMFGTPYDLVSDGRTTQLLNNGAWSVVQNVEMGIASITGVSANAGTLVPSTLMHTSWGSAPPFPKSGTVVSSVVLAGKPALRVGVAKPYAWTAWIDPKTNLFLRTETIVMNRKITVVFAKPKIDAPIPASRFKK